MINPIPSTLERDSYLSIREAYRAKIKEEAATLRQMHAQLPQLQRSGDPEASWLQSRRWALSQTHRARLIAYGLFRGMELSRIENGRTSLEDLPANIRYQIQQIRKQTEAQA